MIRIRRLLLSLPVAVSTFGVSVCAWAESTPRVISLDEALHFATQNQPVLLRQRADEQRAAARAEEARAPLLPQVSARASVVRSDSGANGTLVPEGVVVDTSRMAYSGSLGVDQQLYDFGRSFGRWRQAQALARAQQANTEAAVLDIQVSVSQAFFSARAQRALVDVARETLVNQERHLARVEAFIDVGSRPEIDRAQARTDVANAKVQLIQAENGYAVAKARLRQAMGQETAEPFEVGEANVGPVKGEDAVSSELLDEAITTRPELKALRAQLEAQEQARRTAVGGYFPNLVASANLIESGPGLNALQFGWTAGVTLAWPLFDGWATPSRVRETGLGLVSVNADVRRERQQIQLDVEEAQLTLRAAKATLEAADEALTAARERLRLAEGRYETGVGPLLELSDAQLSVTTAAAQRIQAEFALAASRQSLKALVGRPLLP